MNNVATGREPHDVHAKLEDPTGVLAIALGQWEERDDSKPQPEVRQAASTAMDAIDAMLGELHALRARLMSEICVSDDAASVWPLDDPDDEDEENQPYCNTCGSPLGHFIGHGDDWHHFRGEGTPDNPVELYDAGHAPEVAWRPGRYPVRGDKLTRWTAVLAVLAVAAVAAVISYRHAVLWSPATASPAWSVTCTRS